jgi:hypothetical protein
MLEIYRYCVNEGLIKAEWNGNFVNSFHVKILCLG